MRRVVRSPFWFLILVSAGAALPFLVRTLRPGALPVELGPVRLHRMITGQEARALIDGLHEKTVGESRNTVGFYTGVSGTATLYTTTYPQKSSAERAFARMDSLIAAGNPVFGRVRHVLVEGQQVRICSGMGRTHIYFVRGRTVYWLATDHHLAPLTAHSLLSSIR